jgi:hypothetical protein
MDRKTSVATYLVWVTISSVRTIGLPAPFLWVTEPVSQNTPTQFVRQAEKSFGITYCKVWDIQKIVWLKTLTIIWKFMTTFDQDNFWYPGISNLSILQLLAPSYTSFAIFTTNVELTSSKFSSTSLIIVLHKSFYLFRTNLYFEAKLHFCSTTPLKDYKSPKIFKISLTFRFDKLWHLSKSVHTGENSQILTVSNIYFFLNHHDEFWIPHFSFCFDEQFSRLAIKSFTFISCCINSYFHLFS